MNRLNCAFGPNLVMVLLCSICASNATAVAYPPPQSSDDQEKMKQIIVLITGQFESVETFGAGIIVGLNRGIVYIATANHVVRKGESVIQNLRVQFKSFPEKKIEAELLPKFDERLDLAVLRVVGLQKQGISADKLLFDCLGNSDTMKNGDSMYLVGHPNGHLWLVNVEPWLVNVESDKIYKIQETVLSFQSSFVASGHSGGGLFDKHKALIGMIRKDQPPLGEALSIGKLLNTLKDWRYAVSLKPKRELNNGGGKKWLWIGLGTAAISGTAVAALISAKQSKPSGNEKLPDPPGTP